MKIKKNLFAWASCSEKGTVNGVKGDQTGKEVKVGCYYYFGQRRCIRIKKVLKRRKIANIAKTLANVETIGYGQSDRNSIFEVGAQTGWNYDKFLKKIKKTKVNTDCSMFCAVCVNLGFEKAIFPVDTYTGNMIEYACRHPKDFKIIDIQTAEKKFMKADMPIKEGKHVIINV